MADATLTAKGQTTIPKEIRKRLGLKAGDKLAFTALSDGTAVMRAKTRPLLGLVGSVAQAGKSKVRAGDMKPFRR